MGVCRQDESTAAIDNVDSRHDQSGVAIS